MSVSRAVPLNESTYSLIRLDRFDTNLSDHDRLELGESNHSLYLPLTGTSSEHQLDKSSKTPTATHSGVRRIKAWSELSGWGTGVAANLMTIAVILTFNIFLTIWAAAKRRQDSVVVEGDCEKTGQWMTVTHAVINILGSFVLGASNYAMQVLLSPTREEADKAHRKKTWVFIGGQSFRNFRHVSSMRTFLWTVLAVSSIPFHLM
jgi:hypothetical protein